MASPHCVDVLPYCDVVVESLTKFASGNGDVLMGAGIGIFSVEASYLLLPTINKILYPNHLNSKHTLAIAPNIGAASVIESLSSTTKRV